MSDIPNVEIHCTILDAVLLQSFVDRIHEDDACADAMALAIAEHIGEPSVTREHVRMQSDGIKAALDALILNGIAVRLAERATNQLSLDTL